MLGFLGPFPVFSILEVALSNGSNDSNNLNFLLYQGIDRYRGAHDDVSGSQWKPLAPQTGHLEKSLLKKLFTEVWTQFRGTKQRL